MRVDRVLLGLEMSCSVRGLDLGYLPVIQSCGGADCALFWGEDADPKKISLTPALDTKTKRGVKQPRGSLWLKNAGEPLMSVGLWLHKCTGTSTSTRIILEWDMSRVAVLLAV